MTIDGATFIPAPLPFSLSPAIINSSHHRQPATRARDIPRCHALPPSLREKEEGQIVGGTSSFFLPSFSVSRYEKWRRRRRKKEEEGASRVIGSRYDPLLTRSSSPSHTDTPVLSLADARHTYLPAPDTFADRYYSDKSMTSFKAIVSIIFSDAGELVANSAPLVRESLPRHSRLPSSCIASSHTAREGGGHRDET